MTVISESDMVPRGLEPRTLQLLAVRSNQLSYETLRGPTPLGCTARHTLPSVERRALNLLVMAWSPVVGVPVCLFSAEQSCASRPAIQAQSTLYQLSSGGLLDRRTAGVSGHGGPKRGARSASPPALQGSRGALAAVVWPASRPARRTTAKTQRISERSF